MESGRGVPCIVIFLHYFLTVCINQIHRGGLIIIYFITYVGVRMCVYHVFHGCMYPDVFLCVCVKCVFYIYVLCRYYAYIHMFLFTCIHSHCVHEFVCYVNRRGRLCVYV